MHDFRLFYGAVQKQTIWWHSFFSNTVQNFNFQGHTCVFLPDDYLYFRNLHCLFAGVLISENLLAQTSQSWWPRECVSAAAHFLGLSVQIPPVAWMSVFCDCCLLSGRGLCVGPITRPEESYQVWYVSLSVIAEPRQWGGRGQLGPSSHNKMYKWVLTSNRILIT